MCLIAIAAIFFFSKRPKFVDVETVRVEKGEVRETVSNTRVGTVKACRRAFLAPAAGGQVAELHVREGDSVKQHQLLMEVWNKDLKAQVKLQEFQIKANQATAEQVCQLAAVAEREARRTSLQQKYDIVSVEVLDTKATDARAKRASCKGMVPPKLSISQLVGTIKGKSAIQISKQSPYLTQKPYWGNHFWAKGYCVDTDMSYTRKLMGRCWPWTSV
ncbi:MAG: transposase [Methylococcaceae bacterium]